MAGRPSARSPLTLSGGSRVSTASGGRGGLEDFINQPPRLSFRGREVTLVALNEILDALNGQLRAGRQERENCCPYGLGLFDIILGFGFLLHAHSRQPPNLVDEKASRRQ